MATPCTGMPPNREARCLHAEARRSRSVISEDDQDSAMASGDAMRWSRTSPTRNVVFPTVRASQIETRTTNVPVVKGAKSLMKS